ncbi:MAG: hypothetical protein ACLFTQ_00490 [Candidatus Aenigmatarchaeota archaeon]
MTDYKIELSSDEDNDLEKFYKKLKDLDGIEVEKCPGGLCVEGIRDIYVEGCDESDFEAKISSRSVKINAKNHAMYWDYSGFMSRISNSYPRRES